MNFKTPVGSLCAMALRSGVLLLALSLSLGVAKAQENSPDPTPHVEATPAPSYSLSWDDSTPVAAGAKSTPSHQATFTLSATDSSGNPLTNADAPGLEVISGGLGGDDKVTAGISLASLKTDSNGQIKGTFTSGSRSETTTTIGIRKTPGDKTSDVLTSIGIDQVWNKGSFGYDSSFDYDTASPISYSMSCDRGPIDSHQMHYINTSITADVWDDTAGEDGEGDYLPTATYSPDDQDTTNWDALDGLSSWDSVNETEPGAYKSNQTIAWDEDHIIDDVEFDIVDDSSFGPKGDQ